MKKYLLLLLLFFVATPAFAANTSGYAWSESVGWFDFSNATVSDSNITGYAYNDNTGWLVLDGITNTGGTLSGYAWSESVGYFDFSNVTISSGAFDGYAYNDNTGWLSFSDGTNVTTTWEPTVAETTTIISSGSSARFRQERLNINPTTPPPSTPTAPSAPSSNGPRDLKTGDTGMDVRVLQILLNHLGYTIASEGPGSPGNETEMFGELTRQAVIRFQQENNITPAVGYFGPITRTAVIQKLLATLLTTNN